MPTVPTESQRHPQDIHPSAVLPEFSSGRNDTLKASFTVPEESSSSTSAYDFAQGAKMASHSPAAEPAEPTSTALAINADHLIPAAGPSKDGGGPENEEHVEAALPTNAALPPLLTDATPTRVPVATPVPDAAPTSDLAQAGNELSMGAGIITSPVYQNTAPSAAIANPNSFTSATDTDKITTRGCSIAAIDINATSSSSADVVSSPSTVVPVSSPSGADCLAMPAQPAANAEGTISAHYHVQQQQQRRQPVRMRPSKDNILVARREGFTDVKESGRRTEEEKARGVQRSPDSLLFKWGQHPSQLVRLRTATCGHTIVAVLQGYLPPSFAVV